MCNPCIQFEIVNPVTNNKKPRYDARSNLFMFPVDKYIDIILKQEILIKIQENILGIYFLEILSFLNIVDFVK